MIRFADHRHSRHGRRNPRAAVRGRRGRLRDEARADLGGAERRRRPNGPSANPTISGDDRRGRLAAFDSSASNLVRGDANGAVDVFVWRRPPGRTGLTLDRPAGRLLRVSMNSHGAQANGDSTRPSLDGSVRHAPHCVAFQSTATNLSPGDPDPVSDVYVHDLRTHRTTLVSRGVAAPAGARDRRGVPPRGVRGRRPVLIARIAGGAPRSLGAGGDPDVSLDGSAVTWVRGGTVMLHRQGRSTAVAPGANPTVSDATRRRWGVTSRRPRG